MSSLFSKKQTVYIVDRTKYEEYKVIECTVVSSGKYVTVQLSDGNKEKFQSYQNDVYSEAEPSLHKYLLISDYDRAKNFADTHNLRIAILNRFRDPFDPISLQQFKKIAEILNINI